jgi:COMPASS component SWD2
MTLKLSQSLLKSFQCGRVFKDNTKEINSMDFSSDGQFLVTASNDESIHLYNVQKGALQKEIFSKKYGVDLVRFAHHNSTVICASKNEFDQTLRYLSLHDNRYLRYFKGHRSKVVSLAMSPYDDSFASAALDDTIRFWDLSTPACKGLLRVKGRSCVAFDPKHEHVIAVGCPINIVKLYDDRYFDKGPFETYFIDANPIEYVDLSFSPLGNYILISTSKSIILLDSMKGTKVSDQVLISQVCS